ncbi:protein gvpF [Reticulibacter mediterranei]|uniref:Protein gvpF n=1 Tax=Reticulibacter mediterranei TaxID=2778369 RepID=A0A8J3N2T3_9CHLR|nr:GvpL/GvpF family gas vesicle protein [Reticulibacter mediterranei]GHO93520.1 protein gvpF [Reticulibacter mediterranei]
MSNSEGYYLYGILASSDRQEFGPIGIGGREDVVYTLPYQDIAAIVSRSPIVKYPVTRENTMKHAKVLDRAVEEGTVLPVRFSTISEAEGLIIEKVLQPRYQEFVDLLRKMEGKLELRVRARWPDMDAIFAEVVEENKDIKSLKEELLHEKDAQKKRAGMVKVGEMIQGVLEEKRKEEAKELLETLKPLSLEWRENQIYGDMNLINVAYLVNKEREVDFDKKVADLDSMYGKRKQLKYTRSLVPYNFVEIVIHW